MTDIHIRHGLPPGQEAAAAGLYDQAFGRKMRVIVPDEAKRRAMLADCFERDRAIVALRDGAVVGLAGFHAEGRSFTSGGGARAVFGHLGLFGGLRAVLGFALLERAPEAGELLMDGIAVDARCRGQGVGTRLLRALFEYAAERGLASIRLDVIDVNPRARALYAREGFVAGETARHWFTKRLFGFEAATTMRKSLGG